MSLTRRAVIGLASVALLGAALVLLIQRFRDQADVATSAQDARGADTTTQESFPRTSEELISAALKAGDLSYEESLLERAYALYDDPRLAPAFRSPVVDWEAGMPLFLEVARNEARLSRELLSALAPFRARPNDPNSIFNRPRQDAVKALAQPGNQAPRWVSQPVPFTRLRVWIKGTRADLVTYVAMARAIWTKLPAFFPLPSIPDVPADPDDIINPDEAIDIYVMDPGVVDPRGRAATLSMSTWGWALPTKPMNATTASGYVLLLAGRSTEGTVNTLAHELAHVSQLGIDTREAEEDASWLGEGTGAWVGYKVAKALGHIPDESYDRLDPSVPSLTSMHSRPLFNHLGSTLHTFWAQYQSWLLYESGAIDLGDDVAKSAWRHAAAPGPQGIKALNAAMPFETYFPRFAVRNWHQDFKAGSTFLYESRDGTFRSHLKPNPVNTIPVLTRATLELDVAVPPLAATYYRFRFDASVRRVTFQTQTRDIRHAHVWAIRKLGNDWKEPADWSRDEQHVFCRDEMDEDLSELVIVVSNSHVSDPLPAGPAPRLLAEEIGCDFVDGWATSRLRIKNETQDMTFVSSRVPLSFKPRSIQDQPGNVQFDLMSTSVTWTASGTTGDCTVEGRAIVDIPAYLDQPLDPTRTAWGYMNVVGQDGGDFHSIQIPAVDSGLMMKKTCPGDPPKVSMEPMGVVHLLNVLSQANTHSGNAVVYAGTQTFDPERFQDSLPPQALEVLKNFPQASGVLNQRGGRMVYTFQWELRPRSGTPQGK